MAAVEDARAAARGHEAVLVSHQLPVFVTRRTAERRPLWHRPDRRQCALASVTSLVFDEADETGDGESLAFVRYCEPNGPGINKQGSVGA
jgi:broad specificity phosphatase PhoE